MEAVSILTVKNKVPLFKDSEEANKIELIQLEEVGFEIVAQKELYQIGDKVVYIQPDFCLPDTKLFEGYIRPGGDQSKSYLGKIEGLPRRIRAKKFSFHKGDGISVWSQGILLPYKEVQFEIGSMSSLEGKNLTELLQITKYEAPEDNGGNVNGGPGRPFPVNMYKTDEENINNLWGHIEKHLEYPIHLVGTEKIDGSSITLYYRNGDFGICSRNSSRPLMIKKVVGRRKPTIKERILNWLGKDWFGYKLDLNVYDTIPNDADFVRIGNPYLKKLVEYCISTGKNIALRGELNGKGLKGSGNKNNPSQREEPNIKFFGADTYDNETVKMTEHEFEFLMDELQFPRTKCVFNRNFVSKEELIDVCNEYFSNNMIEGIVVRTLDHSFSAKIMNLEYDSKK